MFAEELVHLNYADQREVATDQNKKRCSCGKGGERDRGVSFFGKA